MAPVPQSSYRDGLLQANRAVIPRIRNAVAPLTPDAIGRRPPDGGWSIAEVLEHLIVAADSYLVQLRPIIDGHAGSGAAPDQPWKPTLLGGLLAQSLRNPRKVRAPKIYRAGLSPRPNVLNEFLARQEEVTHLITRASALDWRRLKMRSPALPIINMNLGDALTVLVVHAERHAAQIDRVKKAIEH